MIQALGALAAIVFSVIVTTVILKVIDATVGLKVAADEEQQGLDLTQHSEVGYTL
ncbi:MAG: hypothetical protein MUP74_01755 [Desulfobacterales bacterium]|nr:hypothetical protein [Desulfobacterales bacterium]